MLGCPYDEVDIPCILQQIKASVQQRKVCKIGCQSAPYLMQMRKNPDLLREVESFNIIVADGQGLVWAARFLGKPVGPRIAIPDLCEELFRFAEQEGFSIFIFGAREKVNQKAVENVKTRFPRLKIAGRLNGYYEPSQEPEIVQGIKQAKPDILLVATPTPHKEKFLNKWASELGIPVLVTVGGTVDILGGLYKRAPKWVQCMGMEGVYRVIQDPKRLWRKILINDMLFTLHILREFFAAKVLRRET